jgi:hypothetical protein
MNAWEADDVQENYPKKNKNNIAPSLPIKHLAMLPLL